MPYGQDFNPNKDINRYLAQQGRAPQSHFDWETWRKIGQPGVYQAPPGSPSTFQGVRSAAGRPNYGGQESHYNMFDGLGNTVAAATAGVSSLFGKMGSGSKSGTKSGKGSSMADDQGQVNMTSGGGGTNRSQNASIVAPATSRGMRRGRGNDFQGALAAHNITMVQGNDNYGYVGGNMGGANVGGGSYDNSFQSRNMGGVQTAFSGQPSEPAGPSGEDSPWAPPIASQGATPRPRTTSSKKTTSPVPQGPAQISGAVQPTASAETGSETPAQAPAQTAPSRGEKIYGLATDQGTTSSERLNAQTKWYGMGYQGPFQSETATQPANVGGIPQLSAGVGPQQPVQGPTLSTAKSKTGTIGDSGQEMVMGPRGVVSKEKAMADWHRQQQGLPYAPGAYADYEGMDMGKIPGLAFNQMPGASRVGINEQGGVGTKPYGPNKKPGARKTASTVEGPKSVSSKKTPATSKKKGTK